IHWSIANEGATPIQLDRVRLMTTWRTRGQVRVYCHGYQSWTATGVRVLGNDDPSRADGSIELVRGMHNSDAAIAPPGELRSELVTVVADDDGAIGLGFDGGAHHDGVFRVSRVDDQTVRIVIEAYFGAIELPARASRGLHSVRIDTGEPHAL